MKNKNTKFKTNHITYVSITAALLAVVSRISASLIPHKSPIAVIMGATKEWHFYILPLAAIIFAKKFGKINGFKVALATGVVGVFATWIAGNLGSRPHPVALTFDYIVPYLLCALPALMGDSKIKQGIYSVLIWMGVTLSWAISGIIVYKFPFFAAIIWSVVTFNGWMMFIILPTFIIFAKNKFGAQYEN